MKLENQGVLRELSHPSNTMLSSSVVTVLAPHWNGRLRRTKRFDGSDDSGTLENLQDVANTVTNSEHSFQMTQNQHGVGRMLGQSEAQLRGPYLGSRRNTVGMSTKRVPSSLDHESKREMSQTVSLDVSSEWMDKRKIDAGASSPITTTSSSELPLFLDQNEQRNPQAIHKLGISSSSSKPTTSSLLLSLRRFHSNSRDSNGDSNFPERNPPPLSRSLSDQNGKLFSPHHSQTFVNNEQDRPKPLLSTTSTACRTTETGPSLSPSSSNHRERNTSGSLFFPSSPVNRETQDRYFAQLPHTVNRQQDSWSSDNSTNLLPQTSVHLPRHSTYDRSTLLKTHSLPRRTTLTSTSWWKQVTQDSSSPLNLCDNNVNKDKTNTPLVPPCNDSGDMDFLNLSDNKRLGTQVPINRDNSTMTESVYKPNMNYLMKTQGGPLNLSQINAENSPDPKSDRPVQKQYFSTLNNRELQRHHSTPDVSSSCKISRATAQTPSHPNNHSMCDVSNSSFTANATELPRTLLNPKTSNPPREIITKCKNNNIPPKNTPICPHNMDSQRFAKPSLSLNSSITLNNQALTHRTTSGLLLAPNTQCSASHYSCPVSSQTSIHASHTGSSSQTPTFTNKPNTSPLGFERQYASIPKPFHHRAISSLIPTVSMFSQTNSSPIHTTSSTSSSTTHSHHVGRTEGLLSPSVITSSLLTPPATPVNTSPNCPETSSPERHPKKPSSGIEGKRARRVTWEDSVDLECPENVTVEKPDTSQVTTNSPSPSSFPHRSPSIFSFLRSSSPTKHMSPLCPPTPRTCIQVGKGGKYRSLSSDSADKAFKEHERDKQRTGDSMNFDQRRQDIATPSHERTISFESGTVQSHSSAPLSLPPDFSNDYKIRYSSPPYSALKSGRHTQGETKTTTHRLPIFPQTCQSNVTPQHSLNADMVGVMPLPKSKPPLASRSLSLPFTKSLARQGSSTCELSETDENSNKHCKNVSRNCQNSQVLLVDNRVNVSSQSLQGEVAHSSSTYVTETLVYSIKSKVDTATAAPKNTTPKPLQHTANTQVSVETKLSQQLQTMQSKEAAVEPCSHSDQSSSGSSSTESQSQGSEGYSRSVKERVLGKSRFFSVEGNNEQNSKRNRFALKKSDSTPNNLSRSESERVTKNNNKMDQVINKLKQKLSSRWSEDDISFPWKWKRASQTPSVGEPSDVSNASDISIESTKTLDEKGMVQKKSKNETVATNTWTQNRYTIIPSSAIGSTSAGDQFSLCPPNLQTVQDEQNAFAEHTPESKPQVHLTVQSPTAQQFDFYNDCGTDPKATNQLLSCRDPKTLRSPNSSAAYPTQFRKSTPSPRSPFSPFSSLSPHSPFSSSDVIDDNVFYSPKLQRRRESSSPCEQGDGISPGGSRKSRASTGPPSISPGQNEEHITSSYADLKYGIGNGRSFSVSSVLSSRPSGPGRISTGSRFMSVGDLSQSTLSCQDNGRDFDQWSVTPYWMTNSDCRPANDSLMSHIRSDPGKMRSRSLPRSLTRCLANWSSGVSPSQPATSTTSMPTRLRSPTMSTGHFTWEPEGPPTPPPTPPLSPVSRRMSKPPRISSSTFPSSSGALQQGDGQSSRGRLPYRGCVSSLSIFEESSDSNSDTTTDDEYYLESDEDREKETEL
ncbi:mucin-5AC isoform X2 [Mugil cephalus]|nr:mucin-5AC isoform X2 [Mugil cephalus]XP_047424455.1 mucin-5AC isoform X2 [Mugil cephalus]